MKVAWRITERKCQHSWLDSPKMMVKIACNSCGHAGIANSSTLPRELQCSRCGDRRCPPLAVIVMLGLLALVWVLAKVTVDAWGL
jgi:hypothetical protein